MKIQIIKNKTHWNKLKKSKRWQGFTMTEELTDADFPLFAPVFKEGPHFMFGLSVLEAVFHAAREAGYIKINYMAAINEALKGEKK